MLNQFNMFRKLFPGFQRFVTPFGSRYMQSRFKQKLCKISEPLLFVTIFGLYTWTISENNTYYYDDID